MTAVTYQKRLLKEEKLHQASIDWLRMAKGYGERFEDREEWTNAYLDSVGSVQGRPWLIEVKPNVGPREALHIECKISASFRAHQDPTNMHPLSVAMRTVWDGRAVPLVVVILSTYSESGIADLLRRMRLRSYDWHFDWDILQWTGDGLVSIASGTSGRSGPRDPMLPIEIIKMPPSKRGPRATEEQLRDIAQTNGVIELFDCALKAGRQNGFSLVFQKQHVTLCRPRGRGWVLVRPKESTEATGLLIGFAPNLLAQLPRKGLQPSS